MTPGTPARIAPPEPERPYALIEPHGPAALEAIPYEWTMAQYKAHGALLLRGFASDLERFLRFSEPFCVTWVLNESRGREMLDSARHIQTVNIGTTPFALHSEISRVPWRPDICFFYCVEPPEQGGETTLCDGTAIVRELPAQVRAALAPRRLRYSALASPLQLAFWLGNATPDDTALATPPAACPFSFRRTEAGILREFTRPVFHTPMFTKAPAFANFLLFARDARRVDNFPTLDDGEPVPDEWVDALRATSDTLTAAIPWQSGDVLIVDNSRFMHGRRRIRDAARRRIASRFGYLRNAPHDPEGPADPIWRRKPFLPPP